MWMLLVVLVFLNINAESATLQRKIKKLKKYGV